MFAVSRDSSSEPMQGLVREVQVHIENGRVLRNKTNDLKASPQEIAFDLSNSVRCK